MSPIELIFQYLMSLNFNLRKGFDIKLKGRAVEETGDHIKQSSLYNHVIKREGALSEKFRELIIIAALCVRLPGPETEVYVMNHIRRALNLGATEDEIFETVQCLIFPSGGPSLMMGVKCLNAVLNEKNNNS